jgi:hypothetical protein
LVLYWVCVCEANGFLPSPAPFPIPWVVFGRVAMDGNSENMHSLRMYTLVHRFENANVFASIFFANGTMSQRNEGHRLINRHVAETMVHSKYFIFILFKHMYTSLR